VQLCSKLLSAALMTRDLRDNARNVSCRSSRHIACGPRPMALTLSRSNAPLGEALAISDPENRDGSHRHFQERIPYGPFLRKFVEDTAPRCFPSGVLTNPISPREGS
jgi:hypothetical protein